MASASPLRRWKPYIAAFGLVDAAIEAAAGGGPAPALSRAAVRSARGEVVEMLCGVLAGGERDGVAEELCVVLDEFMAESLVTLRSVPADAVPRVLASSAGLAAAVAALRRHECQRVRGLARDVVGGWRKAVEGVIAEASAAVRELDRLLLPSDNTSDAAPAMAPGPVPVKAAAAAQGSHPQPKKKATSVVAGCDRMRLEKAATKTATSLPRKKTPPPPPPPPVASNGRPDEKMESTKRKLREGYQEFEDAKRERKIRVIEAPKMTEQRQRKIHPILRERSRARCGGNSTAVRRCLFPSLQRI